MQVFFLSDRFISGVFRNWTRGWTYKEGLGHLSNRKLSYCLKFKYFLIFVTVTK